MGKGFDYVACNREWEQRVRREAEERKRRREEFLRQRDEEYARAFPQSVKRKHAKIRVSGTFCYA